MGDRFLDVLEVHGYTAGETPDAGEVRDYGLPVPLADFSIPEYMLTDCSDHIEQAIVDHLRPFIVEASARNNDECSVGAFINFGQTGAHIFFTQIYIGGVEYPSMSMLKESGDLAGMGPSVLAKLHALMGGFRDAVDGAVAAAGQGHDWLPAPFARYAAFYDDNNYSDWRDVIWFALEYDDSVIDWLTAQPFRQRVAWCRHPCNTALVVAVEDEGDAADVTAAWGGEDQSARD